MTAYSDEAKRLLRLAERDYRTFAILRSHLDAELAPTCFHAQQAVEKALKALLTINQVDFRRTHDLEELANLVADVGLALPCAAREFRRLNPFAADFQYDDEAIALITVPEADRLAQKTLAWVRQVVSEFEPTK
jgi:HEPN domain-containing protein